MHLIKVADPTQAPAAPSAPLPLPPFPSILELTRYLVAVENAYHALDAAEIRSKSVENKEPMAVLFARIAALRDLIVTLPARTLSDAAAQIMVAQEVACSIQACDMDKEEFQRLGGILWRVTLSVLPAVSAAAGIDMAAEGWEDAITLRECKLGQVEALA